jgi:hypothetical protein
VSLYFFYYRKFLLDFNKENPNLVSLPISNISVEVEGVPRDVGSITHIDMGYELASFLVQDGPNVIIRYNQLVRVNFSESKNFAKVGCFFIVFTRGG